MKKTLKAISPLIASILLIVVAVILVTIILAFGKGFTTDALDKTQGVGDILPSDATHFIFPKAYEEGTIQFTYSPPSSLQGKTISITSYQILELPDVAPITLTTPYTLKEGTNTLPLNCLYEHSLSSPDFTIQLITEDNTYITIKQRDAGMVCTSTGDGSEENPKIICSAQDLNAVRLNLDWDYSLGKDIDLQCFSRQDENGWVPIGNLTNKFAGSFDGQNHTISNLYIYRPETDDIGLFGHVRYSEIKNVGLVDVNVIGKDGVGALVGWVQDGSKILFINSSGGVFSNLDAGGLIGSFRSNSQKSYLINSFSSVHISCQNYCGGLAGNVIASDVNINIENSYFSGIIFGDVSGGLFGIIEDDGGHVNITNSYSIGFVSGVENIGGLVALNYSFGEFLNSYWDTETSGQSTSDGGEGKTTTEMKTQSTFTDWDFSTVWAISPSVNNGYPYLRNNPPR